MRAVPWLGLVVAVLALGARVETCRASGNPALAYETVQPARIKLGESATLRVTSLDGYLQDFRPPTVAGLAFEVTDRGQGLEFVNGQSSQAWYIFIRVTPQILGLFTIPGVTPKSPTSQLEVVADNSPDPFAVQVQKPKAAMASAPLPSAPLPRGVQLKAGGAAFVQVSIPARPVYVGESVPVDIELGVRPGIVTSLNGLPTLAGNEFTLDISKEPLRREQIYDGTPFLILTWHSALTVVKPGDFPLSVQTPITVQLDTRSSEDQAFGHLFGWPFSQIPRKGPPPKQMTIASPDADLKVLPLPTQGRPSDFRGAVGDFSISSDASATRVAAGEPLTLRLHVSGAGNFDRVDSGMLDHLDHWRTYPPRAKFTPRDAGKGEKIFEQPLIAEAPGEESIPALEFSYFNPTTQRYEHASTQPIRVSVSPSLADSSWAPPASAARPRLGVALVTGLRPDHQLSSSTVSTLRPPYLRAPFVAVPGTLALLLTGGWFALRLRPQRAVSREAARELAQLGAAARAGDSVAFFERARTTLLRVFAARWAIPAAAITSAELSARLGADAAEIQQLFALADEARYAERQPSEADYQRWLALVRRELATGDGG